MSEMSRYRATVRWRRRVGGGRRESVFRVGIRAEFACCSDLAGFVIVDLGKEVDIFRRAGDKTVHDHGSAPAGAKVRDCGKAIAVRTIRSCSGSRSMWLGCCARRLDQRTLRRPDPRRARCRFRNDPHRPSSQRHRESAPAVWTAIAVRDNDDGGWGHYRWITSS